MVKKITAGAVLLAGLLFAAAWGAGDKPAPEQAKDCCALKLACCKADAACCAAEAKLGCCAKGMKCCAEQKACCFAPQKCCTEGQACCEAAKACCGKTPAGAKSAQLPGDTKAAGCQKCSLPQAG